jgi:hypothetical protein
MTILVLGHHDRQVLPLEESQGYEASEPIERKSMFTRLLSHLWDCGNAIYLGPGQWNVNRDDLLYSSSFTLHLPPPFYANTCKRLVYIYRQYSTTYQVFCQCFVSTSHPYTLRLSSVLSVSLRCALRVMRVVFWTSVGTLERLSFTGKTGQILLLSADFEYVSFLGAWVGSKRLGVLFFSSFL